MSTHHATILRVITQNTTPSANDFRCLGALVAKQLPKRMKTREVAAALGTTKARMKYEQELALGKLVYGVRKAVHEERGFVL